MAYLKAVNTAANEQSALDALDAFRSTRGKSINSQPYQIAEPISAPISIIPGGAETDLHHHRH